MYCSELIKFDVSEYLWVENGALARRRAVMENDPLVAMHGMNGKSWKSRGEIF